MKRFVPISIQMDAERLGVAAAQYMEPKTLTINVDAILSLSPGQPNTFNVTFKPEYVPVIKDLMGLDTRFAFKRATVEKKFIEDSL